MGRQTLRSISLAITSGVIKLFLMEAVLSDRPEGGAAGSGSGFCLLMLPSDLLLTVLQQTSLGPRELCRLEG